MRSMSGGGFLSIGHPLQDPHPNPPLFKGRDAARPVLRNHMRIAAPLADRPRSCDS
jgi:hypothetical protein